MVNDSLGHGAGDELLKIVAKRMVERLKPTDTVVRLGANEFAVMIADQPRDVDRVAATLQDLRAAIAEPIQILGHALQVAS